jgi:hypothetical protein
MQANIDQPTTLTLEKVLNADDLLNNNTVDPAWTPWPPVVLPEQIYDGAQRAGCDMRYYVRAERLQPIPERNGWLAHLFVWVVALAFALLALGFSLAHAEESYSLNPHNSPVISRWFQEQRQPDTGVSCCGEAEAFEADLFETDKDGGFFAIITDRRGSLRNGTRIAIPEWKLPTQSTTNPTGHGIVFLNINEEGSIIVYCYIFPSGA